MSLSVRPAEQRDCEVWIAMRQALWPDAEAKELAGDARRFFERPHDRIFLNQVFVAEQDNAVVGVLELSLRSIADGCTSSPVPYIEGWFVAGHARRQGVGAALVRTAEAWARANGFTEIASDILIENHVSEQAHKALGFEEVDRMISYRKSLA
jgi:aminoglycoside 6'-N-acetyltransferase I